jgi:hypothetical protein
MADFRELNDLSDPESGLGGLETSPMLDFEFSCDRSGGYLVTSSDLKVSKDSNPPKPPAI